MVIGICFDGKKEIKELVQQRLLVEIENSMHFDNFIFLRRNELIRDGIGIKIGKTIEHINKMGIVLCKEYKCAEVLAQAALYMYDQVINLEKHFEDSIMTIVDWDKSEFLIQAMEELCLVYENDEECFQWIDNVSKPLKESNLTIWLRESNNARYETSKWCWGDKLGNIRFINLDEINVEKCVESILKIIKEELIC